MEKDEYIFGTRAVIEAINTGKNIEKVFIKTGLNNELYQQLISLINENEIAFQFVPLEKINRITRKKSPGSFGIHFAHRIYQHRNAIARAF
jgi:23S rRNA (guanosine2251-2'-O)-methyltransferase